MQKRLRKAFFWKYEVFTFILYCDKIQSWNLSFCSAPPTACRPETQSIFSMGKTAA